MQYIGLTGAELKIRFRNEKPAMPTNKKTCEVPVHCSKIKHPFSEFIFIGKDEICNDGTTTSEKRLFTKEGY